MIGQKEYRSPRPGEIAAFLSRHAHQMKQYDDELRFRPCPICRGDNTHNPPIQINQKTGLWRCFKCGNVGNWFQLTKAFGEPLPLDDRYKQQSYQACDQEIIEKFIRETRRPVFDGHYKELLDYCSNRGIGIQTLRDWRVSSKGDKALRWPIYDLIDGKWQIVNMKVKSIDPNAETKEWFDVKGGPTDLLIGNHLIDIKHPDKRVFIFEGQFDAMTAHQIGIKNAFSLPNGSSNVNVSAMLRFIPDDWEIYLGVDMDQAGDLCAERFYAQLGTEKLTRLRLPHKDLNEWFKQDPFINVDDIIGTTSKVDHFFLEQSGFIKLDMSDTQSVTSRIACRTPWQTLNDRLAGGLFEGQTTGLLGPSGQGKTTWVNQLGIGVAASQINVGLISVEGSRESLLVKLKDTIKNNYETSQFATIESHLLISNLNGHKIQETELYKEVNRLIDMGSRLIIIDNLDHVFRGDSNKKSDAYGVLIEMAITAKIHIIMVWQPHKVDRGAWVNSGSQKGFSMMLQDSDNYLSLNRIEGGVCIDIEKTRERGISQDDSQVYFDWDETKRSYIVGQNRFTNQSHQYMLKKVTFGTF